MKRIQIPIRVTVIYAAMSMLWIFLSDRFVYLLFKDTRTIIILESYKGYFYIIISGFIIYKVLQNENNKIKKVDLDLKCQVKELNESRIIFQETNERYKLAIEGAMDVIWEYDFETDEFFISNKIKEVLGYETIKIEGLEDFLKLIYIEDRNKAESEFKAHLEGRTLYFQSELRVYSIENNVKWIFIRGKALKNEENINKLISGSITDITERKMAEEKISFMAYHDFLTNLPNKYSFTEKLEIAISNSISAESRGAVIFVDLDDFKTINDTFGHDHGDNLLKIIGDLIETSISKNGFAARHSGDEFFILIPEFNNIKELHTICNNIIDDFKAPFEVLGKQLYTSGSMGITIFPDDGVDTNTLYKNAETAMYVSKRRGKDIYSFFDKGMFDSIARRNSIEHELRNAVENNELSMCYQPIVNTISGNVEALEALIRWNNPVLGNVTPGEFIPIAEETGLIIKIGIWVLKTVASQHAEWMEKGYEYNHISINASPIQIQAVGFCGMVREIIEKFNIDPKHLEIEVTEGTLIKSFEDNADILKDMMTTGIKISIDDFGSGYSSLNYLTKLPINTLKIDKSFIDRIDMGNNSKNIVNYIIKLSHELGYIVIAEGVETKVQLGMLEEMGCDLIQGYYFSKPLLNHEIEKLLLSKKSLTP
jgi:diguanylate cyclase (GGDEF)-like protein/PAS domain S-box-containing protein